MDPFATIAFASQVDELADAASSLISAVTTSGGIDATTITFPGVIEYAALITGAISGSAMASERGLDIIGAIGLAIVTGLGGGLLRDMILPTSSIYMLDHPLAIVTCIVVGMLVFFFRSAFSHINVPLMWADILSVAFFAFSGADKTLMLDYNALACIMIGTLTAIGGGVVRDICLSEVPSIFKRGTFYAIAALAGATVYVILSELQVIKIVALIACLVVTIVLRVISVHYNLQSMTAVDLTPNIVRPLRKLFNNFNNLNHNKVNDSINTDRQQSQHQKRRHSRR